jgi:hypothetical protein
MCWKKHRDDTPIRQTLFLDTLARRGPSFIAGSGKKE